MQTLPLDPYILDVLMRDLVGHDRSTSAFVVYLWLWSRSRGVGRATVGASLQTIATETGLSKSSVQNAVRLLSARRLIGVNRRGFTEAPVYQVFEPWMK
jgi:hypothetical protein